MGQLFKPYSLLVEQLFKPKPVHGPGEQGNGNRDAASVVCQASKHVLCAVVVEHC
jgi:hypothetical protein